MDWQLMGKCTERLRPVATATEEVESDSATLLTVARFALYLKRTWQYTSPFPRHVENLRNHWGNQEDFSTFHGPALQYLGT